MLSLTYGFNTATNGVLFTPGNVSIPNMSHFFPQGENPKSPSLQDEEYTAHVFVFPLVRQICRIDEF